MKLISMQLENFGPYYGRGNRIEFPQNPQRNVLVVHGANMRGKTRLLEATHWVLFGDFLDRGPETLRPHAVMNWDAVEEETYRASVLLTFEHAGTEYRLERQLESEQPPSSERPPASYAWLRVDGKHVAEDQIQRRIEEVIHPDISRFFFFDGEMLDEYQRLMRDPDLQAQLVSDAIESILGVPAFSRAADDIQDLRQGASRRLSGRVAKESQHRKLTERAGQLSDEADRLKADVGRLEDDLKAAQQREDDLRQKLAEWDEFKEDARRLGEVEGSEYSESTRLDDLRARRRQVAGSTWWMPVFRTLEAGLQQVDQDIHRLSESLSEIERLKQREEALQTALSGADCPTCGQQWPEPTGGEEAELEDVRRRLAELGYPKEDLPSKTSRQRELQAFRCLDPVRHLRQTESDIRYTNVELQRLRLERQKLQMRIGTESKDVVASLQREWSEARENVDSIRQDLKEQKGKRSEVLNELQVIQGKIARLPSVQPEEAAEEEILRRMEEAFEGALSEYRLRTRDLVEKRASDIFLALTTEPEYAGLKINENFGLHIVTNDGRLVDQRSRGADQIVALSLIGALKACAVREGPLMMDTPFGRLDPYHKGNVLSSLPGFGSQVVLLVQASEVDEAAVQEYLSSSVGKELQLVREGPTRTRIAAM